MTRSLTKDEISELPVSERLRLIEALWDSLDPNDPPLPESHRDALDESLADYRRDPDGGEAWDEVRKQVFLKR